MEDLTFLRVEDILRCPKCRGGLKLEGGNLVCRREEAHSFPVTDGIPSFVKRDEVSPEDARWVFPYDEMAEEYDEAVRLYDDWLGVDLRAESLRMLGRLPMAPSQRILDVSTGTGAVIFGLEELHPGSDCCFVGVDLSMGMLRVAQRKFEGAGLEVLLFHSQVTELPFEDEAFDIVTNSGGINTFRDIPAALREWVRVLRPGGTLLIADEGLSPSAKKTRRGLEIVKRNKLFGLDPPLEHLPPQLSEIDLCWVARDAFYALSCRKLSEDALHGLETDGTEYEAIRQMVEKFQKK